MFIWFQFWLLKKQNFKLKWLTRNWTKQRQWKPFLMEDVRNLKTLGLAQNYHVQNQYSLNIWNKNWKKKKTFLKHLNVAIHLKSGCHFFLWAPYWYVLLSAVFLLPVGWMASCWHTRVHRPEVWACVFSMKFTVVTAERWTHFLIFPPQCCDKIQRNPIPCTEMFLITLYFSMERNMVPFLQLLLYTHTYTLVQTYSSKWLCGYHCFCSFYFPVNFEWRATFLTRLSFQTEDLGFGGEFRQRERQRKRALNWKNNFPRRNWVQWLQRLYPPVFAGGHGTLLYQSVYHINLCLHTFIHSFINIDMVWDEQVKSFEREFVPFFSSLYS